MSPPPYSTRVPPGCYSLPQSTEREPRSAYTNHAFAPSAPPPPYDDFVHDCHEVTLPRYSSLSHPTQSTVRPSRPHRSAPRRNIFILWVAIILVPTVIFVGTLVVILIASE